VRPRELDGIAAGIERADAPRHLFSLRVAERVDAAETFFAYREVDASRGGAGYLQLGLPLSHTPQRLLQLAELASQEVPMWWGSAGFLASGHPSDPCTSLSAHWAWSRRYQGIDVHDLERARRGACDGIVSVNWLTLLGEELFERRRLRPAELATAVRARGCTWLAAPKAAIVQAGDAPLLGDLNAMALPHAYHLAADALRGAYADETPRMAGRFWHRERSSKWARRFLEPEEAER
jgi:hypothetical protein